MSRILTSVVSLATASVITFGPLTSSDSPDDGYNYLPEPQVVATDGSPPIGDPMGDPYTIILNNAQQAAAIAGAFGTFTAAACLTTAGIACSITTVAAASSSAYMSTQAMCPNGGVRRIVLQDYFIPHDEFDPKAPRTSTEVVSSTCGPA